MYLVTGLPPLSPGLDQIIVTDDDWIPIASMAGGPGGTVKTQMKLN